MRIALLRVRVCSRRHAPIGDIMRRPRHAFNLMHRPFLAVHLHLHLLLLLLLPIFIPPILPLYLSIALLNRMMLFKYIHKFQHGRVLRFGHLHHSFCASFGPATSPLPPPSSFRSMLPT
ncbi:hypothetical protein BDN70DRAFT_994915 [Pholiota conissans]|uniref:Uncharacterized protein n=1 Tax=Pholiota conissans TaxID=109636 RepID=A0A9P5YYG4_9AGAR|nr:hypothetical protein BDN70DRAFT_994915 [Pholiota conissans]